MEIFDPKEHDYYIVIFENGDSGGYIVDKGALPDSDDIAVAEKVSYSTYLSCHRKAMTHEVRLSQAVPQPRRQEPPHYLRWLLFGYFCRQASIAAGSFFKGSQQAGPRQRTQ